MKKRRIGMSLIVALLIVVPTFSLGAFGVEETLDLEKQVWDPVDEEWTDYIEAEMGQEITFNITITYYNSDPHYLYDIYVNDTLPSCLDYVEGSAQPFEPVVSDKNLSWHLSEILNSSKPSYTITFNATVVGYGENENLAEVEAYEYCTGPEQHYDSDVATVCVPTPDPLEFEKQVWDPETEEWVEDLPEVRKGTLVRFQITVTYVGVDPYPELMKCMIVYDFLPEECLEYAGNEEFVYPDDDLFDDPEIYVSTDLKYVEFDWRGKLFNLYSGQSVVIRFDANVTEYCEPEECQECCECVVQNCALVDIWACEYTHLYARDCANVTCVPPAPIFEKKVKNPETGEWVEEAGFFVGDTARFKIELTYYGSYKLGHIKIIDVLPCILIYADNANINETNVSTDKKTITWDLPSNILNDGETLTIEFDAVITGISDCPDCGTNIANYTALECETVFSGGDEAKITSEERPAMGIDIKFKSINIGRVTAYLINIGETEVSDIEYTISAQVGILFGRITIAKRSKSGTIDTIKVGKSKSISTYTNLRSRIVRRFGKITVHVTATFDGETVNASATGRVFGRIILLR
jgi:fimbrial isopeptide formation D2 family protein